MILVVCMTQEKKHIIQDVKEVVKMDEHLISTSLRLIAEVRQKFVTRQSLDASRSQ